MELPREFNLSHKVLSWSTYKDDKINKYHNHCIPDKFLLSPQSGMKLMWTEQKKKVHYTEYQT